MVTAFIPSRPKANQLGALSPQQCTQTDTNIVQGAHTLCAHTSFFFKQLLLVFMKPEVITRIKCGVFFLLEWKHDMVVGLVTSLG